MKEVVINQQNEQTKCHKLKKKKEQWKIFLFRKEVHKGRKGMSRKGLWLCYCLRLASILLLSDPI